MSIKTLKIASFAIAAATIVFASSAFAASTKSKQMTDDLTCKQAVVDAKEARENEPDIGDKSAKVFDEIVRLAEQRCAQKEYAYAAELLNIARGMVASE